MLAVHSAAYKQMADSVVTLARKNTTGKSIQSDAVKLFLAGSRKTFNFCSSKNWKLFESVRPLNLEVHGNKIQLNSFLIKGCQGRDPEKF
jgi:hypothetical protein